MHQKSLIRWISGIALGVLSIAALIIGVINYSNPSVQFEQPKTADLFSSPAYDKTNGCELNHATSCCLKPDFSQQKTTFSNGRIKSVEQTNIRFTRPEKGLNSADCKHQRKDYDFIIEHFMMEPQDSQVHFNFKLHYDLVLGTIKYDNYKNNLKSNSLDVANSRSNNKLKTPKSLSLSEKAS